MRAVTHIHTERSWDSRSSVARLADALLACGTELALVCDHNSFAGSLEMRELIRRRDLPLQVPVAAEIRTDRGDVIVIFENGEPPDVERLLRFDDLTAVTADHGGLVWLPHPYQSHSEIEEIAAAAHVIEVFNARCSPEQNADAVELCERHGAVPAFGADIHRLCEVGRFMVDYQPAATVCDTLLSAPSCPRPVRTRRSDVMAAEVVNGIKRRRPALTGYQALKWMKHRSKEIVGAAPPREDVPEP